MTNLSPKSVRFAQAENDSTNPSPNPTMGEIISERFSRRDLVKGALAVSAIGAAVTPMALLAAKQAEAQGINTTPSFVFKEVTAGVDDKHYVAEGYDSDILIRWGDAVLPGAPPFDPAQLNKNGQAKQFGYNNDYLGYFPIPGAPNPSEHGLLCVNHEYTNEELMFPGLGRQDDRRGGTSPFSKMTPEIAEVEMMAHGGSVLEVKRTAGKWAVVPQSTYARRVTAETEMRISGPAAGHDRMKTGADPAGRKVLGMLNNCAGGRTPWVRGSLARKTSMAISRASSVTIIQRCATTSAWAFPAAGTIGATTSTGSTSPRNPMNPTDSAGSSRSIRSIRLRPR
jgi:hypothetical protein